MNEEVFDLVAELSDEVHAAKSQAELLANVYGAFGTVIDMLKTLMEGCDSLEANFYEVIHIGDTLASLVESGAKTKDLKAAAATWRLYVEGGEKTPE